jgi:serpin B
MLTLTGAMLLSFSCEKKEENLTVPVENNKEEAVEVVVTEAEPMVEEPAPVQLPETRLSLNEEQTKNITPGNDFSFRFFEKVYDHSVFETPGTKVSYDVDNMFMSPLSVQFVCGMLGNLMEDQTSLSRMLGFEGEGIGEVNEYFKTLIGDLVKERFGSSINLANAIMRDIKAPSFPEEFIECLKNYYYSDYLEFEAKSLDELPVRERPEDLWVKDKTSGLMDSAPLPVVPEGYSLLNVLCFKADWVEKFDPSNTTMSPFSNAKEVVGVVPMMRKTNKYPYFKNDDFRAVSIPMGEDAYYLTVILPSQDKPVREIVKSLDSETWNMMRASLVNKELHLGIPKFTAEFTHNNLFGLLNEEFVKDYFSQLDKNLSEDFDNTILFNMLAQKSLFRMDEDGATAATVTQFGYYTSPGGDPDPIEVFNADHPFVYAISEAGSGLVLFLGTYSGKGAQQIIF